MPYIKPEDREKIGCHAGSFHAQTAGELNFQITEHITRYLIENGLNYQSINDVVGALEGAKLEFYRRVASPYEDKKIAENGDVYPEGEN